MAETAGVVVDLTEKMLGDLDGSLDKLNGRVGKTKRYLEGNHDDPYAPSGVMQQRGYREVARKSITNWLPLISNTYTQGLFVDGYRPARSSDNASAWQIWQANGMDARQTVTTRGALDYGTSYGLTLPSKPGTAFMRPLDPTRTSAWFEDEDDEWPVLGVYRKGKTIKSEELIETYDDENVYTLVRDDRGILKIVGTDPHGLGVTPLTRFRTRLGAESVGVIWPLIPVQDRINETVFALNMAIQYASFRQRWAKGLKIDEDENGDAIPPFDAAVDTLWHTDNPDAAFGDFAQTDVNGHLQTYLTTVRTLAALGQISPNVLTGDLINLSAEALAQLQDSTRRQLSEFETIFGESYEQWLRLASFAAGDRAGALDLAAETRWRDTEARALSATVDALGKMVQMLGVPPRVLWERIPGVTDTDVERWEEEANKADSTALLASALGAASAPASAPEAEAA